MKKIVKGRVLQDKMLASVELLCGTVKETLGPKGQNVLIDHSNFRPFITNDGVTIAKNIESEDETIGAILEILKEASIKTNEEVGDGTTTTLVLLESLYKQSLEYVNMGESSIWLKKELDRSLEVILERLEQLKRKPTNDDLKNIAFISAGDDKLGDLAYQVLKKVRQKRAINIKEDLNNKTVVTYLKGYLASISLASPFFLKDMSKLSCKNALVLIINGLFTNLENISFLLNDVLKSRNNLVIIASGFDELAVEELLSFALSENLVICLLKIEEYGIHVYEIMKDIEVITGAIMVEQESNITSKNIGRAENIDITKDTMRIDFKTTKNIKSYEITLKKQIREMTNDLDKDFYDKRGAMFGKGMAEIKLGAPTKTECLEKRMRLEDALSALSVASEGILPGSGISLLTITKELDDNDIGMKIWREALKKPWEQIISNAGLNIEGMKKHLEKNNYKFVYNILRDNWEMSTKTKVLDPYLVIRQALINANSIAGMLLTTSSLIINEYQNNSLKEAEYNSY